MKLTQLWWDKTDTEVNVKFDDKGRLGVTCGLSGCVYGTKGIIEEQVYTTRPTIDVDYHSHLGWVFIKDYCYDVVLFNPSNVEQRVKKLYSGVIPNTIKVTNFGYMTCNRICEIRKFNRKLLWEVDVGLVIGKPSYYRGYWYIPDWEWEKILVVRDGSIVNEIKYGESAYSTATCGGYLAVTTENYLHFYDISDPENPVELWKIRGLWKARRLVFSTDCRYIVVADTGNRKLKIFDINGNLIVEKEFENQVRSVDWWRDRIAVATKRGYIYVYKIEGYEPAIIPSVPVDDPLIKINILYNRVKQLYQQILNDKDYKALFLKGPFHRNITNLTQMSSLIVMLTRINQFYQDLKNTLEKAKDLVNKEPTLNVMLKTMNLIQRARMDIDFIKMTLNQADQVKEDMTKLKPVVAYCYGDPLRMIEDLLKINDVKELLKLWFGSKYSNIDNDIKCLISQTIDEIVKNYESFRSELLNDLAQKEKTIAELENKAKMLSIS